MDNNRYLWDVDVIKRGDTTVEINKAIRSLTELREKIKGTHPEYTESIVDVDFYITVGAYRTNNKKLFESLVQRHMNDTRFKKQYQYYVRVETENLWSSVIDYNKHQMQKTFVRSMGLIFTTALLLSIIMRK